VTVIIVITNETSKRKNAYEMSRPAHTIHIYICGLRLDLFENTVNNHITKINKNNATSLHLIKNKIVY